jgi:signal transduction histidine kinase
MTGDDVRILIVDDQEASLTAMQAVLKGPGRVLVPARSGREALRWLLRENCALILLDVHMPGLDGYETAELIRARARSQSTPIIFVTATSRSEAQQFRGYAAGAVDYVFKPVDPEILRAKVAVFVDLHVKARQLERYGENLEQLVQERTAALTAEVLERKRAEQEVRDLNASLERRVAERTAQLEEASRAKTDFLANMSHELRTPLNAIIGFSEMLKDGVLGELEARQRGFVADIFEAGTHLLSLINDVLDLSKVEAGALRLEAGAADVAALIKASTLVVREKALADRIRLDTHLDPALGTMLADQRKLKQIVYNLLSNAVKFTPEGGAVTLRARRCARAEVAFDGAMPARLIPLPPGGEGEFLAITVEDNGVGIAEEHLAKLFEPFTQVDSSITRRHAGTGLGLSLVRRLVELHGGTVGVASAPGAGSRFCVWLPYRAAAAQERRTAPESTSPTAPAGTASTTPVAPLALVIEDDDRMADMIAVQLRAEGFEMMRAATAEEGLVRASKCKPQLITLDIFLPAMDGWEFMRRLKADPQLAHTPVVIITVSEDLDRGLALGARRVLQKPFASEELMAVLAGLLGAGPDGARARVLVVDDNVKAVELVAAALEAEGYCVLRAYGGAEAIEATRNARPDLVILDLMMSEVSGFEVARALRACEQTARIPILVLTAMDLTAEDRARLHGNVSAVLEKTSFGSSDLLAELRRAIALRKTD